MLGIRHLCVGLNLAEIESVDPLVVCRQRRARLSSCVSICNLRVDFHVNTYAPGGEIICDHSGHVFKQSSRAEVSKLHQILFLNNYGKGEKGPDNPCVISSSY